MHFTEMRTILISLRTADAFPVVASFRGREATTGNASAVRRLYLNRPFHVFSGKFESDLRKNY